MHTPSSAILFSPFILPLPPSPCISPPVQVLVGYLVQQGPNAEVPRLADRLLQRLLDAFPALQYKRDVLAAMFQAADDEEEAQVRCAADRGTGAGAVFLASGLSGWLGGYEGTRCVASCLVCPVAVSCLPIHAPAAVLGGVQEGATAAQQQQRLAYGWLARLLRRAAEAAPGPTEANLAEQMRRAGAMPASGSASVEVMGRYLPEVLQVGGRVVDA